MSNLEANRLELRSDLAELKRLAGWIKAQTQQGLSADTSFAIQLCLEEAVTNIIMHGGGAKDDRLRIAIELERDGGTLVARIEDTGWEFDPPNSHLYRCQSRSRRRKSAIVASTSCAALRVVCITNGKRAAIG